jgi:hypothetical protein
LRSGSDFVSDAVVLWHLKVILRLVCLNRLVILRMCGEEKVKVAHFILLFVFVGGAARIILCCICRFNLRIRVAGKLLALAMCRTVCHSWSCWLLLSGRLSILSI